MNLKSLSIFSMTVILYSSCFSYGQSVASVKATPGGLEVSTETGRLFIPATANEVIPASIIGGLHITIGNVLANNFLPNTIVIGNFRLVMSDSEEVHVMAASHEEDNDSAKRSSIIFARAQTICNMSGFPYIYEVHTENKILGGKLIDLSAQVQVDNYTQYKSYNAKMTRWSRIFQKIVCGRTPKGYQQ